MADRPGEFSAQLSWIHPVDINGKHAEYVREAQRHLEEAGGAAGAQRVRDAYTERRVRDRHALFGDATALRFMRQSHSFGKDILEGLSRQVWYHANWREAFAHLVKFESAPRRAVGSASYTFH